MAKAMLKSTRQLITAAHKALTDEWPMTLRQVFYRLVSVLILENCLADYRRLGRALTIARKEEMIPWK